MKKKTRPGTLPGKIKAATSLHEKRQLAFYGRVLSEAEREAELHFRLFNELPKSRESATAQYINECLERSGSNLAKRMVEAVEKRDGRTLIAIAKHLESLQTDAAPEDVWRWKCLGIKDVLEMPGGRQKIKFPRLAKEVGWPAEQSTMTLRRIAQETGVPLDLSR